MRYRWQAEQLHDMMALPAQAARKHLKLASGEQWKVLLWLAQFGRGNFDAAACAKAIGSTPEECEDAFCYWTEAGVLALGKKAAEEPPEPEKNEHSSVPAARPRPVKPQMPEVIAKKKSSRVFSELLDTASARLGRPIANGEMETLLYLYDTAGLPAEVILLVIGYAKAQDKPNMRYIEKVALDWADRDINTMVKAEAHLCRLERHDRSLARLQTMFPKEVTFRSTDVDYADIWFWDWQMAEELVAEAYRQCYANIQKFNAKYMHAILSGWHSDGVTKLAQVKAAETAARNRSKRDSSLDMAEYKNNMQGYIPKYENLKG